MIHIIRDPSAKRLKLKCDDPTVDTYIRNNFTMPNKAAAFSDFAPSTVSIFSLLGSFKAGMLIDVLKYCRAELPDVPIKFGEGVKEEFLNRGFDVPKRLVHPKIFNLRDNQKEVVRKAMALGYGCFDLCTSFGKSASQNALIATIWQTTGEQKQALILVPNIQLVTQFYNDMLEYGNFTEDDICMFSGSVKNPSTDKKIIISNRQYIQKHFDKLPNIELLLIDEVHTVCSKGSKLIAAINKEKMFDTKNIWGFSGTFPEDLISLWNIYGTVGPMLMSVKAHELQDTRDVAQTVLKSYKFLHRKPQPIDETLDCPLERAKSKYPLEYKELENCELTNYLMVKHALSCERNTFMVFDHTEHGKNLLEIAERENKTNKKIFYIDGTINIKYRDEMKLVFEKYNDCLVIGNRKCIGTGLSIKNVSNIFFSFTSGSSLAGTVQVIGRSLRIREDKDTAYIHDYYHDYQYSTAHYEKRLPHYEDNYKQQPEEHEIDLSKIKIPCFL